MIKKDEVFKIGIFNKPHGVKGEISFTFTDDIFDRVECEYLVCLLDGIFVPFFIEEYRFRSDTTALVKLEGVDTSEKARMFTNVEVYFPKKYVSSDAVGAVKVLVARVTVSAEASAEISTSFSTSRPLPLYEGCKTSSWQLANPRNRQSMNMYRIAFLISSYSFQ